MEKWDVLRRWHSGQAIAEIAGNLCCGRKTVRSYMRQVHESGVRRGAPLPEMDALLAKIAAQECAGGRAPDAQRLLEEHLQEIDDLINDRQLPLRTKIAFEVLVARHRDVAGVSYSSFKRLVRRHQSTLDHTRSTCRMEVPHGSEVQIDYAKVGTRLDPATQRNRTVYVFIGTLGHSRH
jgi:hypothetical protein